MVFQPAYLARGFEMQCFDSCSLGVGDCVRVEGLTVRLRGSNACSECSSKLGI